MRSTVCTTATPLHPNLSPGLSRCSARFPPLLKLCSFASTRRFSFRPSSLSSERYHPSQRQVGSFKRRSDSSTIELRRRRWLIVPVRYNECVHPLSFHANSSPSSVSDLPASPPTNNK